MKRTYMNIWMLGVLTLTGCSTRPTGNNVSGEDTLMEMTDSMKVTKGKNDAAIENAEICRTDEMAKVVKLLRPATSMYYDERTGKAGEPSHDLAPGYYNYQGETTEYYLVCLGQDGQYTLPKNDAEVATWTAAQGHGYVLLLNEKQNTVFLKSEPSDDSRTIESFSYPDGIPAYAECLGISGKWYKVKYDDKIGYVKRSEAEWSISHAEACGTIR